MLITKVNSGFSETFSCWVSIIMHWSISQSVSRYFLSRDAMLAWYMPWSCVRPSVCRKPALY